VTDPAPTHSRPEAPERARIRGVHVAAAWIVAWLLSYWGLGGGLADRIEGMDPNHLPLWPMLLAAAAITAALGLSIVWSRSRGASTDAPLPTARRRFLFGGAVGLAGLVGSAGALFGRIAGWATTTGPAVGPEVPFQAQSPRAHWKGARVRAYRPLGRTGFDISDISLGSSKLPPGELGERIARGAIERGVNYFDTAPDYVEAGSELSLGRAMRGVRDQMFVATKFCTPHGNLPAGTAVDAYMHAVEESLARLQTDYVDLVHIHSCDTMERLLDPNAHEAFDRLKEQGKVRHLGVSTHTPDLEPIASRAIDSGRFDVLMLAYHHGAWPSLPEIIDRAAREQVGVVAMKTLKGAKHRGLLENRDEADSYTQAAFKWVLANPSVSGLVISFRDLSNLDEYLHASGQRPNDSDLALLRKYDERIFGKHCHAHCGACLDSCPEQLRIDDVLRHRMYFEDYGAEKEAMRLYAKLEKQADVCVGCAAPCAGACPFGIAIQERSSEAHRMLTLG